MEKPLPFRYTLPTKAEMQGSRLLIEKYQQEIGDYTTRLNELYSLSDEATDPAVLTDFHETIQDLSARLEVAKKRRLEQEVFIAPIRKLPAELLAMILVFHVTDYGHTPWNVLSVCRSWRNIAFGTPWMWNKIHVQIADSQIPTHWRFSSQSLMESEWNGNGFTGGIKCQGYNQLKFVLERSGVVPLDIKFDAGTNAKSTSRGEIMNLLWTQNGYRWRHVEIKEQLYGGYLHASASWDAPNPSSLPLLESLRIESDHPGGAIGALLNLAEKTSTKLHTLHISQIMKESLAAVPKLMRQIKHASWQHTRLTNDVWSSCSRLESLAVMGPMSSPFIGIPDKHYTRLHTLAMLSASIDGLEKCGEHLNSLTHVVLCHVATPNTETLKPHTILLPSVTHFTLVSQQYTMLPYFFLPSLESLELYGCNQNESDANIILDRTWNTETFGKSPCPSRVLHLETSANDAYILAALRFWQNIKQIFFHCESPSAFGSRLSSSFAQGPSKKKIQAGEAAVRAWKAPQCPQLEELIVVCKRAPPKETEACLEKLKKVQQVRLGTASEMKRVDVLHSKGVGSGSENRAHDLLPGFQR